jgi:hypothetical protein
LRGKRAAAALVAIGAVTLTGCTTASHDNPALSGPASAGSPTTPPASFTGPKVSIIDVSGEPVPSLAGEAAVDTQLSEIASALHGRCQVTTLRDDTQLASFEWRCGSRVTTATFELSNGKRLSLADLFDGSYVSYLQSTAKLQFQQSGVAQPDVSNLSNWALTPTLLLVNFPAGTISFPLATLSQFVRPQGPLSAGTGAS